MRKVLYKKRELFMQAIVVFILKNRTVIPIEVRKTYEPLPQLQDIKDALIHLLVWWKLKMECTFHWHFKMLLYWNILVYSLINVILKLFNLKKKNYPVIISYRIINISIF